MSFEIEPGMVFADRFLVNRLIARGGMGAVYEVLDRETNRHRALKILHPHLFHNDDLREKFLQEARVTGKIRSDHLVDVFHAGIDTTTRVPFLVMELLEGESLGTLSRRVGALPVRDVLIYLRQIAIVLAKVHAEGIVHRDLKPDNLFLTQADDGSPRIKLLDFGIAKIIEEDATAKGTGFMGTPLYMAPEQIFAGLAVTSRADVYALGLLAFTLFVGVPYWHYEMENLRGPLPFLAKAIQGPNTPAVERAAYYGVELPRAFNAWFSSTTALVPEDRYSDVGESMRVLEQAFSSSMTNIAVAQLGFVSLAADFIPSPWEVTTPMQTEDWSASPFAWRPPPPAQYRQSSPIVTNGRLSSIAVVFDDVMGDLARLTAIIGLALCCAVLILWLVGWVDWGGGVRNPQTLCFGP